MLKAQYKKHTLIFKTPAGTSRGVLKTKDSWFLEIWDTSHSEIRGIGECSIIPNLSIDNPDNIEVMLDELCVNISEHRSYFTNKLQDFPAIKFALETALIDLQSGGKQIFFESDFTEGRAGIPINGLIWMGDENYMRSQMEEKIHQYPCVKMKIGAISFEREIAIIKWLRETYGNDFELRVDANGAFSLDEVYERLLELAQYNIHSIEQPIKQGQWSEMATICTHTPIPIVLDEELIGINSFNEKAKLLDTIKPHYIILKPSLLGGFKASHEWIMLAQERNIDWWITSALESNIGLNAIAQWTYVLNVSVPQGLGTGSLYTNNIDSPLFIEKGMLWHESQNKGLDIIFSMN